jgi:cytidylate kinase
MTSMSVTITILTEKLPLKPSEESVIADTSKLSLDESIALIVKIIKEHM